MKKLMIAAAVVCAAVAAQAFSVNYSLSGFKDSMGGLYNGEITVYWRVDGFGAGSGSQTVTVKDGSVAKFKLGDATYSGDPSRDDFANGQLSTMATDSTGAKWVGRMFNDCMGWDLDFVDNGTNGEWTAAPSPVPEPTSGLLLLLGVAGLALKRKQK